MDVRSLPALDGAAEGVGAAIGASRCCRGWRDREVGRASCSSARRCAGWPGHACGVGSIGNSEGGSAGRRSGGAARRAEPSPVRRLRTRTRLGRSPSTKTWISRISPSSRGKSSGALPRSSSSPRSGAARRLVSRLTPGSRTRRSSKPFPGS